MNPGKTISKTTCREYMKVWGYSLGAHTKDVYMDDHEQEDVVLYRGAFVSRLQELEPRMSSFEGDDMHEVEPTLADGVKKVVLVTFFFFTVIFHGGVRARMRERKRKNRRREKKKEIPTKMSG